MQMHQLKRKNPNRKGIKVGRGGKRGKTSGRGTKGQKARAGRKLYPEIRDRIKKIPKLRGYRFASIQENNIAVNLDTLSAFFKDGELVNSKTLIEKGIIKMKKGKFPAVKILGRGEMKSKISVEGIKTSESAKALIEKAGGKIIKDA